LTKYRITLEIDFSAPFQTRSGVHLTFYAVNTGSFYAVNTGSFSGIKWPGRGFNRPPTPSAEVKERVELNNYASLAGYRMKIAFPRN